MKGVIVDKNGNTVKEISLGQGISFIKSGVCTVCEDISDYVGYYIKVSNNFFPDVYYGIISTVKSDKDGYSAELKHIIYDLDNIVFNGNYTNADVGTVLNDILDTYIQNTSHGLISKGAIDNTGINITYNFNNVSALEAITILQRYLKDGYLIRYDIGSLLNISLTQDSATPLDKNDVASIGYGVVSGEIVNKVTITNNNDVTETVEDTASQNKYGIRYKKYVFDISTSDEARNIGTKILQEKANPVKHISSVEVKDTRFNTFNKKITYDNNEYYITGAIIKDNSIIYNISYSPLIIDYVNIDYLALVNANAISSQVNKTVSIGDGWVSSVVFTAVDYNTVAWNAGSIYDKKGNTYNIVSGDTGDMTETTYIYLDLDVSDTTLQTTTNAKTAVGSNKLLVCVAGPVDDTSKKAEFQAFGNKGSNRLITGDTIAANTITGDNIVSNTITSTQINTSSINISEWAGTLDDVADGQTYNKVLSTYLEAGKIKLLSKGETSGSSIKLDADSKLFQLTNSIEDPHGDNGGSGETIELTLRDIDGNGDIIPILDFYDDGHFTGGLYGDYNHTISIAGTDYILNGIFTTGDFISGRNIVANKGIIGNDNSAFVKDLYVYGGRTSTPVFYTENEKLNVNTCIRFSDGTELCSANSGSATINYKTHNEWMSDNTIYSSGTILYDSTYNKMYVADGQHTFKELSGNFIGLGPPSGVEPTNGFYVDTTYNGDGSDYDNSQIPADRKDIYSNKTETLRQKIFDNTNSDYTYNDNTYTNKHSTLRYKIFNNTNSNYTYNDNTYTNKHTTLKFSIIFSEYPVNDPAYTNKHSTLRQKIFDNTNSDYTYTDNTYTNKHLTLRYKIFNNITSDYTYTDNTYTNKHSTLESSISV